MAIHSSVLAWRIPGGRAWWAAVYGVAQSGAQLKRLSSSSMTIISADPQFSVSNSTCKDEETESRFTTEH